MICTYEEYLKQSKAISFEKMQMIHAEMIAEIGSDVEMCIRDRHIIAVFLPGLVLTVENTDVNVGYGTTDVTGQFIVFTATAYIFVFPDRKLQTGWGVKYLRGVFYHNFKGQNIVVLFIGCLLYTSAG